jgi:hypothetical protein
MRQLLAALVVFVLGLAPAFAQSGPTQSTGAANTTQLPDGTVIQQSEGTDAYAQDTGQPGTIDPVTGLIIGGLAVGGIITVVVVATQNNDDDTPQQTQTSP